MAKQKSSYPSTFIRKVETLKLIELKAAEYNSRLELLTIKHERLLRAIEKDFNALWQAYREENKLPDKYTLVSAIKNNKHHDNDKED